MKSPLRAHVALFAAMAALTLSAMSPTLPNPYTRVDPYSNLFGDPTRGPEPDPNQVELPLVEWDEALARATCNTANPYDSYGHFRLRNTAWQSPYIVTEGSGSSQMTQAELDAVAALFGPTQVWADGTKMKYQLMAPPAGATMPPNGWPLVLLCPGSGAVGRSTISTTTTNQDVIWGSTYYRTHYPAYVIAFHPQIRTVTYPSGDLRATDTTEAFTQLLQVTDHVIASNPVDPNRIYAVGFSMGGSTVWQLLLARPDFFAAVMAAAGRPLEPGNAAEINLAKDTPIWMCIGNKDPWAGSSSYIRAYHDLVASGAPEVRFWEVQDMAHVEFPAHMYHLPEWLFAQTLDQTPVLTAPAVTIHPASQTVVEGQAVTLSAGFSGTPFPAVQWKKDNVVIDGATGLSYSIAAVAESDEGSYTATATNSQGSATTNPAVLTVNPPPAGAVEIRIDFETAAAAPGANWNSVPISGAYGLVNYLNGAVTPVGVSFSGGVTTSTSTGQWGTRTVAPPWTSGVADPVLSDRFFITEGASGTMTLSGLTPGHAYDIELAASYGGAGTAGDDDGVYILTDASGPVTGYNAHTMASLGTSVSWIPRGPGQGGIEGWLGWYGAVAKPDGTLSWALSAPTGSNPRVALNAMRVKSVAPPEPVIPEVAIAHTGGSGLTMTIATQSGFTYTLEESDDMGDVDPWAAVPGQSVPGDGTQKQLTGTLPAGGRVFYRIRVE